MTLFDAERVTPEFRRQFRDAARFAIQRYQSLAGDPYGVRWLPVYSLSSNGPIAPASPESVYSEIEPLFPEAQPLGPGDIYMFPRHDGVLLGGTHDRDVWDTSVDPAVTDRILRENAALFGEMQVGV